MQPIANRAAHSLYTQFPLGLYLLGALGILSGDWLSLHLYRLLAEQSGHNAYAGRLTLVCAPLTLILGWLLWYLHHRFIRNRTPGQSAFYYLCAFVLVGAAGWLAVASEEWLRQGPLNLANSPWTFSLAAAVMLGFCWFAHSRLRKEPEQVVEVQKEITVSTELAAHCRALILFVSTPNIVPKVNGFVQEPDPPLVEPEPTRPFPTPPAPLAAHVELKDIARDPKDSKECKLAGGWSNLESDIKAVAASKIFWNWQQLLRALRAMRNLEAVYLLGSPDSASYKPESLDAQARRPEFQANFKQKPGSGKGSYHYLRLCRAFLESYLPPKTDDRTPVIIPWARPVDFENFNALSNELRGITGSLRSQGLDPTEVLVDVTGGQKVTSIAGAVLTVNNELRFQYVQTNDPYDSVPYDLVRRADPTIEAHVGV